MFDSVSIKYISTKNDNGNDLYRIKENHKYIKERVLREEYGASFETIKLYLGGNTWTVPPDNLIF